MRDHLPMKICDHRLLDELYKAASLDFNYLQFLLWIILNQPPIQLAITSCGSQSTNMESCRLTGAGKAPLCQWRRIAWDDITNANAEIISKRA